MPTYEYRREDGTTFEIEQRITEPALRICPTTGQPVRRLISAGAGLVFKGSGFYLTDYARSGSNSRSAESDPKSPPDSKKSEPESKTTDSTPKTDTESSTKKD